MKWIKKLLYNKYYIFTFVVVILFCCFLHFIFIKKIKYNDHYIFREVTYIGHGTYGVDNLDYTNSVQGLELGYKNGIRVMEVDFLFTSDGRLVLNHYWENGIWEDSNEFLNKKIKGSYTAMDILDLLKYMEKYDDLYIVMDTKENEYNNGKSVYDVYREIVNKTREYNEKLLDKFIIQLYSYDDLKEVNKIYEFKNKMFTMYKLGERFNIYNLVYYCLRNDVSSIVIPYTYFMYNLIDEDDVRFIRSKNIDVYVNTINDYNVYNNLLDMGVSGVYTDFLN